MTKARIRKHGDKWRLVIRRKHRYKVIIGNHTTLVRRGHKLATEAQYEDHAEKVHIEPA